jgi:hypothetical protein
VIFFRGFCLTLHRKDIQGEHSNFVCYVPIKKLFLWSHDIEKLNFKMTARPLTVIPLKCTGVPITQPKKIILMYKRFFNNTSESEWPSAKIISINGAPLRDLSWWTVITGRSKKQGVYSVWVINICSWQTPFFSTLNIS